MQVSVIALGSENPALKQLASLQRARGEGVFYHYLSDQALYHLARGVQTTNRSVATKPDNARPAPDTVGRRSGCRKCASRRARAVAREGRARS